MNKYINNVNDKIIIEFLKKEVNGIFGSYYIDFFVTRHAGGCTVYFRDVHCNKYFIELNDYYSKGSKPRFNGIQKKWNVLLAKKFGSEYITDLRETLDQEIRKKHVKEISEMCNYIDQIKQNTKDDKEK